MSVDFKPTEERLKDDVGRAIFQILGNNLRSSVDGREKASKIADDVGDLCYSLGSTEKPSRVLWEFFLVLTAMIGDIPSDHPWQDVLANAVDLLRERRGAVGGSRADTEICKWEDLSGLQLLLSDIWTDPTNMGGGYEYTCDEVVGWMRLNSFVARISSAGFIPWPNIPALGMYEAFEDHPPEDRTAMDCRVWVATEWLLRAGPCVWDVFCQLEEKEVEGKKTKMYKFPSYPAGPLCVGVPDQGIQKWEFWRGRLLKLAENWDQAVGKSTDTTRDRILQTVQHMDFVNDSLVLK